MSFLSNLLVGVILIIHFSFFISLRGAEGEDFCRLMVTNPLQTMHALQNDLNNFHYVVNNSQSTSFFIYDHRPSFLIEKIGDISSGVMKLRGNDLLQSYLDSFLHENAIENYTGMGYLRMFPVRNLDSTTYQGQSPLIPIELKQIGVLNHLFLFSNSKRLTKYSGGQFYKEEVGELDKILKDKKMFSFFFILSSTTSKITANAFMGLINKVNTSEKKKKVRLVVSGYSHYGVDEASANPGEHEFVFPADAFFYVVKKQELKLENGSDFLEYSLLEYGVDFDFAIKPYSATNLIGTGSNSSRSTDLNPFLRDNQGDSYKDLLQLINQRIGDLTKNTEIKLRDYNFRLSPLSGKLFTHKEYIHLAEHPFTLLDQKIPVPIQLMSPETTSSFLSTHGKMETVFYGIPHQQVKSSLGEVYQWLHSKMWRVSKTSSSEEYARETLKAIAEFNYYFDALVPYGNLRLHNDIKNEINKILLQNSRFNIVGQEKINNIVGQIGNTLGQPLIHIYYRFLSLLKR